MTQGPLLRRHKSVPQTPLQDGGNDTERQNDSDEVECLHQERDVMSVPQQ